MDSERQPLLSETSEIVPSDEVRRKPKLFTSHLLLAIASCVLGSSFQFGYNTGVINSPEEVMKDFYNSTYTDRYGSPLSADLETVLWSLTVAIYAVGGMVGGVSAGYWANRFGRKGTLLRNNLVALVAAGLLGFSKMAGSYEMLIVGRFVSGLNAGVNTGVAPLYLSEIAPNSLRGFLGTFNQLAITLGVLVSETLGLGIILGTADLWPILVGLTAAPVVLQVLLLPWCPESPRYLMLHNSDEDEAERALIWLRQTQDVGEELEEMRIEAERLRGTRKFTLTDLTKKKSLRRPLIITLVMQLSQQFSGINAVIYYSTSIFMSAGLSKQTAQYGTVMTGVVNVLMTFLAAFIMDRIGRRSLHMTGMAGMFVFSLILSIAIIFKDKEHWLSYVCIAAVICYIIFFAIGPGAIPWFITAELFSQGPRSAAMSLAVLVNWLANFTVGLVFPELQERIKEYSFLPFVVMLAGFFIFTFFNVPETKGKTIEEITAMFEERRLDTQVSHSQAHFEINIADPNTGGNS